MAQPNFYSACYAIIENEKKEVLFQRRANTGFLDGCFQIPAGHMDGGETMKQCMARELKEELDIHAWEENMEIVHISHRIDKDREYFDVYVRVDSYSGEIKNAEPHKCSELTWIDIDNLEDPALFQHDIQVIKKVRKWGSISEFDFR